MKKVFLLLISICITSTLSGQWLGTNPVYFNAGNVGIGTNSPWAPLTLKSTSTALAEEGIALAFEGGGFSEIGYRLKANGSNYYQVVYNGSSIQWKNWNGSSYIPKLSLTNSGYLGIGTTNPNSLLHLDSDNNTDLIIESGPNLNSTLKLVEQGTGDVGTYLKYDGNSNRFAVFVGNNSPIERLSILRDNGNVGIGTTSPNSKLEITTSDANVLTLNTTSTALYTRYQKNGLNGGLIGIGGANGVFSNATSNSFSVKSETVLHLGTGTSADLTISTSGNVGVGTTSPTEKLSVDGNILAKKVRVSIAATDWPDYVFTSNYKLRSLSELEAFIQTNHRLPEVPSAKEVETNGLDLGNMDATLLKKVEELTLYLIQESKEKDDLKKENKELKETLQDILKRLEKLEKK